MYSQTKLIQSLEKRNLAFLAWFIYIACRSRSTRVSLCKLSFDLQFPLMLFIPRLIHRFAFWVFQRSPLIQHLQIQRVLQNLQNKKTSTSTPHLKWIPNQQPSDPVGKKRTINTPFEPPTIQSEVVGSEEKGEEAPSFIPSPFFFCEYPKLASAWTTIRKIRVYVYTNMLTRSRGCIHLSVRTGRIRADVFIHPPGLVKTRPQVKPCPWDNRGRERTSGQWTWTLQQYGRPDGNFYCS
jgi:hypothetical protein